MKNYLEVIFNTWNGGKYGKGGTYQAIVSPRYFKNGNLKKTDFEVVKIVRTIEKEYRFNAYCATSRTIAQVLRELSPEDFLKEFKDGNL